MKSFLITSEHALFHQLHNRYLNDSKLTLESGIDGGSGINEGDGKFPKSQQAGGLE